MKLRSLFKKICFCILIISVFASIGITAYAADADHSILGDVNNDSYVTNLDRYALNRYLAGKASLADTNAADINRDGKITTDDLDILSKHLANYPGYQNLYDFAVDLVVSSVTIDKSNLTIGESVTVSAISNRPIGDITLSIDVYLNGSAVDHISGGNTLQYAPVSEGKYSFDIKVNDRNGNEYQQKLDNYLEVEAPTPKLEDPVLMYPNLPTREQDTYPYFDDDFTLRWNEIEGAVSYTIKFSLYEDGEWEENETIEDITEPFYEMYYDEALTNVGKCEFEIFAYDKNGNFSVSDFYYFQWGDDDDILVRMGTKGSTWTTTYEEDTSITIQVESNSYWEAETSDDWITLKKKYSDGDGIGQVKFDIDENDGDFARTGTITVINEYDEQAVFTIIQGPDDSSNQGYYDGITYPEYGDVIDYKTFDIEWDDSGDCRYKLVLKDITANKTLISTSDQLTSGWYEVPKSKLSKGHIYQITVIYYGYSNGSSVTYSSVFQVEGDSEDYEDIGGGSGTRGDTGNDEGATSIILSGLVDGSVVDKRDLHISWEEVLGACGYGVALRDLTAYPDSLNESDVVKALDIRLEDLNYIVSSGKLAEGHSYRLWVAAMKSDGSALVNKTFRFSVKSKADCGTPSTDFNTATVHHTIGDPFKFEGTVSANGGVLEYIQITITETATGKYCDYAIYDSGALGNASSFNLSAIYNVLTGGVSSVQTSGSGYARAGSQTLSLSQAGSRYVITIYARNKGQGSNTIIATKNIELVAKPYISVYDENGNSLNGKTISTTYSAFSNKKIFVETNMNIAAWADSSKAFSMVLTETKYTSNGKLYTYTVKGTENSSGFARLGELRIYQSDSGKVTSTSELLASIKVNQSGNPNMPVVSGASIKDGNTTYNLSNDLVLKVGDHNVDNGYTLIVNMSNNASANWTVYTDDFRVARAYRKNGKVYINANALGTTSLYISHKYASSYDDVDPATLIKICDIVVERPEKDFTHGDAEAFAEAVIMPYYYDYLDAESGYDDVSEPLLFILEVMAKGIIGTAEFEISEAVKNSDVGLDGGRDIIHQMVLSEMLGVNTAWEHFLGEFSTLAKSFKPGYAFTVQEAAIVSAMSKLSDSEYIILLDENGGNQSYDNANIRNLWQTLIDNGLTTADMQNDDTMDFYRRMSKAFSGKSLVFLEQANKVGKVVGIAGKAVDLSVQFGGYFLLGTMQDEVDALIDSWIAATDDPGLIAELEAYKEVYSSAGGMAWNAFTDSNLIPGLAQKAAKEFGGMLIAELAKKGIIGEGAKQWIAKYISEGAVGTAIKVICSADSYIMVSNVIAKFMLGVDANAVYTATTNLLVIDPIYRELIEEICAYEDEDYYMYDSYVNKVRLAAALAKLEYKYCIDIFKCDMATSFGDKKDAVQQVIDEYTAYSNTISENLDDFVAYIYELRKQ